MNDVIIDIVVFILVVIAISLELYIHNKKKEANSHRPSDKNNSKYVNHGQDCSCNKH